MMIAITSKSNVEQLCMSQYVGLLTATHMSVGCHENRPKERAGGS